MIIDHENQKNKSKIIEVLTEDTQSKVKVWLPAMATSLTLFGRDGEVYRVKEIRVRRLEVKACTDCKEAKSYDKFYKAKSRYDGLSSRCKDCEKARGKLRPLRYLKKSQQLGMEAR